MENQIVLNSKSIDLECELETNHEVLKYLVSLLEKQGFVDSRYTTVVMEREDNYPTGLEFPKICIALPHGDPKFVKEASIAIARCKNRVDFKSMENPEDSISVDIVVLLAVKEPERHLQVLSNLVNLFMIEENCEQLLTTNSVNTVCNLFESNLYKGN